MGNSISPRGAKVYSYNDPVQRVTLQPPIASSSSSTSKTRKSAEAITISEIINRKDWKSLHQLLITHPELVDEYYKQEENKNKSRVVPRAIELDAPVQIINDLLTIQPSDLELSDIATGFSLLHYAGKCGSALDVVQYLQQKDFRAIQKLDRGGNLPLHIAVQNKPRAEIIEFFIDQYPTSPKLRNKVGALPIHLALEQRASAQVIDVLLKANPDCIRQSFNSKMPLHIACEAGASLDVIEMLLECDESVANVVGAEGQCPLHFAVAHNKCSFESIKRLTSAGKEALKTKSKLGSLPLHKALESKLPEEKILHLIDAYQDGVKEKNRQNNGNLPLSMAISNHASAAVVLRILQLYPEAAAEQNSLNLFPLLSAIKEDFPFEVIEAIFDSYPEGAGEVDDTERSPLHYAISRGFPSALVEKIIKSFPTNLSKADLNGQLPVHLAGVRLAKVEVWKLLINYGKTSSLRTMVSTSFMAIKKSFS